MAVYVARGICAVASLYLVKRAISHVVFPSKLSDAQNRITEGPVYDFAAEQAKKLGLKKLIVAKGPFRSHYGNSLFGSMGVSIGPDSNPSRSPSEWDQFHITHMIAHIQSNDVLYAALIPLITSLFTLIALNHIAPIGAAVAGFAAGVISFALFWRGCEKIADLTAMRYCSDKVKVVHLECLKKKQEKEGQKSWLSLKRIWKVIVEPSTSQRIQYCQAFIDKQVK
jgi:hypothetical protein